MLVEKDSCNGWFDYEGMVCDADGTEWEATCQRVVSESDLTAAADGVLLCIGPQHGDDGEEYHGQDDHASGCDRGWLGDGHCDSACDNEAWGFDMGDCDNSGPDPDSGFDTLPGCARELVICQDTLAQHGMGNRCMEQLWAFECVAAQRECHHEPKGNFGCEKKPCCNLKITEAMLKELPNVPRPLL